MLWLCDTTRRAMAVSVWYCVIDSRYCWAPCMLVLLCPLVLTCAERNRPAHCADAAVGI